MTITKLQKVDGYTLTDLDGAKRYVGPLRSARKVLERTTTDLVRHVTYALAVHGVDGAGAAAALNYDGPGDGESSPVPDFVAEVSEWAERVGFVSYGSLGFDDGLANGIVDPTSRWHETLTAASAVASVTEFDGPAIICSDEPETGLADRLKGRGVEFRIEPDLAEALSPDAGVVFVKGKTGVIDHEVVAESNAGRIVGLQPLTTTARGLAVAGRRGTVVVPDFVSAAGPYLAISSDAIGEDDLVDEIERATAALATRLSDEGTNLFVAACEIAEQHMSTWTDDLPFGRPLAP